MRKSTKGALAGAAAGLLLLGGWGTGAGWEDDADVPGGDIESGTLTLGTLDCAGGWKLGSTTVDLSVLKLVPGMDLIKVCTFTLTVDGEGLEADLEVSGGGLTGDLATHLEQTVSFADSGGQAVTLPTTVSGTKTFTATISVTLPDTLTGLTGQGLEATLADLTITATQAS